MEIAEDTYTKKIGKKLTNNLIFTANEKAILKNTIIGDLQTGKGVHDGLVDCFILPQTLSFIYDVSSSCRNIIKMLKLRGLITARRILLSANMMKVDEGLLGLYKTIFKNLFSMDGVEIVDLVQYGNVKTAIGFLLGLASEELSQDDFKINDELYPVILGIAVIKL